MRAAMIGWWGLAVAACASRGAEVGGFAPLDPVPAAEHEATLAAMRPPLRDRPVIAVLAQNEGTETTDFLVPYGVLARSGVAEVVAVATEESPVRLTPALAIETEATIASFDQRFPEGADYVVVPKIEDADDPAAVAWILEQRALGSTIVGICSGAKTLSAAGLLEDRAGTGHWRDLEGLREADPTFRWVPDRRYVADRGVVTTTGVSASLPASLALVEAIAGPERAAEVALELGVASWDERHDSSAFGLDGRSLRTALGNRYAAWNHETWTVPVGPGVDEIALAFEADAWSRTYRSRAVTVTEEGGPVRTRDGLLLLTDPSAEHRRANPLAAPATDAPADALPDALAGIAERYGRSTADFVALQLEYAWRP